MVDDAAPVEELRRALRRERAATGMSFGEQARLLGVPRSSLERFDKGMRGMTAGIRQGVATAYPTLIPTLTAIALSWLRRGEEVASSAPPRRISA